MQYTKLVLFAHKYFVIRGKVVESTDFVLSRGFLFGVGLLFPNLHFITWCMFVILLYPYNAHANFSNDVSQLRKMHINIFSVSSSKPMVELYLFSLTGVVYCL